MSQRFASLSVLALALLAGSGCAGFRLADGYHEQASAWQRTPAPLPADEPLPQAPALERALLVREVLRRNPTLHAARWAWRAALERVPQVTSLDDPVLGLGFAPRSLGSDRVHDSGAADLSQKFPFPGKLALHGQVALAEAEAAEHDFEAVRLRLAAMASLLYDDLALVERALEINAEHLGLLEEFQQIASARYAAGEAAQQDPVQAEVELAHAVHREVVLETDRRVTMEQINLLLHRAPDATLPAPPRRLAAPETTLGDPDSLLAAALQERPELRAAQARVAAGEAGVALARREFFPDFTLLGRWNGVMQEPDLQPFVGVALNVPLAIGRRRAALEQAKASLEEARSRHRVVEDEVRFDVRSRLDRLHEAQHVRHLFRDRLVPAARDQVEAARAGFETGRNSFLALIDAQRNLLDVELGLAESVADVGRRCAELDRALGRVAGLDWEVAP